MKRSQFLIPILFFILFPKDTLPQAGQLDITFGNEGIVTTAVRVSGDQNSARSVAIQDDGRIVVVGTSLGEDGSDFAIVRYNIDGSLDNSFGTNGIVITPPGTIANSVAIQDDGKIVVAGFANFPPDFAVARYNSEGELDNTFGENGIVITEVGLFDDQAQAVAIQNDGKIIAAGHSRVEGSLSDFAVVRYLTSGFLDNTFGTNGIVTTAIGNEIDHINSVAIQSNGKIVAVGAHYNGSDNDFAVVRYNTNGVLDAIFGDDGIVTTGIGTGTIDQAYSVSIQNDGKIVVAGSSLNEGNSDFAVVRYDPDGELDNTFRTDGIVTTPIGAGTDIAHSVAIQIDGKIIAAGYSLNDSNWGISMARYNADGTLDNSFGANGILLTQNEDFSSQCYSIAIQSDDKILAAGNVFIGNDEDFVLFRFHPDGELDNTFANSGIAVTPIGISESVAWATAIQSDGKIIAAGWTHNGSDYDFAVVRFNPNGEPDISFGANGILITPIGTSDDYAHSVVIQNDDKIVAVGFSENGSNDDFALVRYNADGELDNTFGTNGIVVKSLGISSDIALSSALQDDGKLVIGGYSNIESNYDFALARFNTDGSLDSTFGTDGLVITEVGATHDYIYSLKIQEDGKIVAAGYFRNGNNNDFAVVRYDPGGELDNTFGTNGIVTTQIGTLNDGAHSVTLQSDGKIIAAGYSGNDFAIIRYNSDGELDNTFGSDGIVITPIGSGGDFAFSVLTQADSKIIVTGYSYNGADNDFAIARYNPDGELDNTFGSEGILNTGIGNSDDYGYSMAIQDDGNIVVAGYSDNGDNYSVFTLVRYTGDDPSTGIYEESNDEIPAMNALLQNYPNPFNPTTSFKFRITDFGFVTLKVYDVLGSEVTTLVNEEKHPGNYEITFDASGLSSGVYFYKLSAGNFVETKKLILMK